MAQPPVKPTQLKKGAVGFWHAVYQSISYMSPAGDVAILLTATALFALGSMPLSLLIAWLIYALWLIVPYLFSQEIVNVGSYYAYSVRASGFLGVLTLWYWITDNFTCVSGFGALGFATVLYYINPVFYHIPYLWVAFAFIVPTYGAILSFLGIKKSLDYAMYTGFAEVIYILIASILIVAMVLPHIPASEAIEPFTPAPVNGAWSLVFLGTVFSILDFVGLGSATTISEEVKDPKRTIKRALIIAWFLGGLALLMASYALTLGWGINNMSSFAQSPDPGFIVFYKYLGLPGWALLLAFVINSYAAYAVAKFNSVSRLWFSAARDGLWFKRIGADKVHPHFKTPYVALVWYYIAAIVLALIAGLLLGPFNGSVFLLTIDGLGMIMTHIVANTALTYYKHKTVGLRGKDIMFYLLYVIAPTVASITAFIVFFYSVYPLPSYPFNIAVLIAIGWFLAGLVIAWWYSKYRAEILKHAGASYEM
ncbi:MAG: APC family permease [Vulcanisaeta sp.]|jgi:amino acid transporter